ncbi:hypothetical protein NG798_21555 [Ancylothrix sp. C2]|uniref:hypothetical protein n=1 Tax=Ancylothrix sp. D3o TaxID=2953691 RepID=UPI0021BB6790|nr:hypothetical protein [Ancylothrix sp. D3o]MCT7952386.1 hypothetical protein [Ancylothrix sp. D3o]
MINPKGVLFVYIPASKTGLKNRPQKPASKTLQFVIASIVFIQTPAHLFYPKFHPAIPNPSS